jgi:hypothetical protein
MNVSQAYADDLDLHSFNLPSLLMAPPYLFTAGGVGLIQIAAIIGFCIALFLGGWLSDVITARQIIQAGGKVTPEQRLVSLIPFVWVTPVACILTGFAASRMWPWAGIAFSFGMREYPSDWPLFDTNETDSGLAILYSSLLWNHVWTGYCDHLCRQQLSPIRLAVSNQHQPLQERSGFHPPPRGFYLDSSTRFLQGVSHSHGHRRGRCTSCYPFVLLRPCNKDRKLHEKVE